MARLKLLASQWNHKSALHHTMLILSWDGKVQVKWYPRSQRTGTGRQWHGKMCLHGKAESVSWGRDSQRAELQHFQLSSWRGLAKSLHVLGEYLNARGMWDKRKMAKEGESWAFGCTTPHFITSWAMLCSLHSPESSTDQKSPPASPTHHWHKLMGGRHSGHHQTTGGKCSQPTASHARHDFSRSVKHFPAHRPPEQISKHTAAHDTESQPHEQVPSCAGHVLECTWMCPGALALAGMPEPGSATSLRLLARSRCQFLNLTQPT